MPTLTLDDLLEAWLKEYLEEFPGYAPEQSLAYFAVWLLRRHAFGSRARARFARAMIREAEHVLAVCRSELPKR